VATATSVVDPQHEQDAPTSPQEPVKSGGKRRLILLAVPVVLVAAAVSGLWITGIAPRLLGLQHAAPAASDAAKPPIPVYVDLPEMISNLNGNPRRPSYVKLQARLELSSDKDLERVKAALPRLQDLFQTYLRDMHPEELSGSAGTYRLREELIARANLAVAPAHVANVLFLQILVQ
jgi:flagellar FliL protein